MGRAKGHKSSPKQSEYPVPSACNYLQEYIISAITGRDMLSLGFRGNYLLTSDFDHLGELFPSGNFSI